MKYTICTVTIEDLKIFIKKEIEAFRIIKINVEIGKKKYK